MNKKKVEVLGVVIISIVIVMSFVSAITTAPVIVQLKSYAAAKWGYNQTSAFSETDPIFVAQNSTIWSKINSAGNRTFNQTLTDSRYLYLNGSNANQNINISPYNLYIKDLISRNITVSSRYIYSPERILLVNTGNVAGGVFFINNLGNYVGGISCSPADGYCNYDVFPASGTSYMVFRRGDNLAQIPLYASAFIANNNLTSPKADITNITSTIITANNITATEGVYAPNICYSNGTGCTSNTQQTIDGMVYDQKVQYKVVSDGWWKISDTPSNLTSSGDQSGKIIIESGCPDETGNDLITQRAIIDINFNTDSYSDASYSSGFFRQGKVTTFSAPKSAGSSGLFVYVSGICYESANSHNFTVYRIGNTMYNLSDTASLESPSESYDTNILLNSNKFTTQSIAIGNANGANTQHGIFTFDIDRNLIRNWWQEDNGYAGTIKQYSAGQSLFSSGISDIRFMDNSWTYQWLRPKSDTLEVGYVDWDGVFETYNVGISMPIGDGGGLSNFEKIFTTGNDVTTYGTSTPYVSIDANAQVGGLTNVQLRMKSSGNTSITAPNINIAGNITTDNLKGLSKIVQIGNATNTGNCSLIYTNGLYTGGTC